MILSRNPPSVQILVLLLLAALTGWAQAPAGGYLPHRVERLEPVPEPAGGLIPYRKGRLWGYADTTGRVWIRPSWRREPAPFALGFGVLTPEQDSLTLVNARGELLRASTRQAIGFTPPSALFLMARRGVGFRPVLAGLHYPKGSREAVRDTLWLSPDNKPDDVRLSPTRGLRYKPSGLPGKLADLNPQQERGALIDEEGKPLTKYQYATIGPFVNGFARAQRTGRLSGGWVLLDRSGREVVTSPHASLTNLYRNRALVDYSLPDAEATARGTWGHAELVDSTGRVIRAFPAGAFAWWLVEGTSLVVGPRDGPVRFYDVEGHDLLPGQAFASVARFWNNRLWVRTMDGQEGLLDRQLRWVAPAQYQALYHVVNTHFTHAAPASTTTLWHDTAYAVVKQSGKYGLLAYRTGRVVVPIRYDTVMTPLTHGFAALVRSGRSFVVNAQGKELTEGTMQWTNAGCRTSGCWATVVRGKQATVLTEEGWLLCPWWDVSLASNRTSGNCVLPSYGHRGLVVVHDCQQQDPYGVANLVDRAGRVQLPWLYKTIEPWPGFYSLRLLGKLGPPQWLLYDEQLRPLLAKPVVNLRAMAGQWMSTNTELIQAGGKHVSVPLPASQWFSNEVSLLPEAPFATGVWRVEWYDRSQQVEKSTGYLTLGSKQLWEEE